MAEKSLAGSAPTHRCCFCDRPMIVPRRLFGQQVTCPSCGEVSLPSPPVSFCIPPTGSPVEQREQTPSPPEKPRAKPQPIARTPEPKPANPPEQSEFELTPAFKWYAGSGLLWLAFWVARDIAQAYAWVNPIRGPWWCTSLAAILSLLVPILLFHGFVQKRTQELRGRVIVVPIALLPSLSLLGTLFSTRPVLTIVLGMLSAVYILIFFWVAYRVWTDSPGDASKPEGYANSCDCARCVAWRRRQLKPNCTCAMCVKAKEEAELPMWAKAILFCLVRLPLQAVKEIVNRAADLLEEE